MDASDSEVSRASLPRRLRREIGFWVFGVVTAIAVNLLSNDAAAALRVLVAGTAIVGVLFAVDLIRKIPPSSTLRHYARPVMITLVAPLILMSAVGAGGGYLIFVGAALVAVGVSSERDVRTAVVTLLGMTAIAGGASGVHLVAHLLVSPAEQETGLRWLLVARFGIGSLVTIALGVMLLARGERLLLRHMNTILALRLTIAGVMILVSIVAGLDTIRSTREAADALVAFSFAVSALGYCLLFFMPPDGADRIRRGWRELTRSRAADEQHPPYREVVLRMFQAVLSFIERHQNHDLWAPRRPPAQRPDASPGTPDQSDGEPSRSRPGKHSHDKADTAEANEH